MNLFQEALRFVFGDLHHENRTWFRKFYFNRKKEEELLLRALRRAKLMNVNVGLVGRRGVGKTSFLRHMEESEEVAAEGFVVRYLDLKDVPAVSGNHPGGVTGVQIDDVLLALNIYLHEYYEAIGRAVEKIDDKHSDYFVLCRRLPSIEDINKDKECKRLLLIIDDIDYTEPSFQIEFLNSLRPLLGHPACTVVYAVRPEAERTAKSWIDARFGTVFRHTEWVYLYPLNAGSLIESRLRFLIKPSLARKVESHIGRIVGRAKGKAGGDDSIAESNDFRLTDGQIAFLESVSNGSATTVLGMTELLLKYIKAHREELEHEPGYGYRLGWASLLEIHDIRKVGDAQHSIVNIHVRRSKKQRPLLRTVLEFVYSGGNDEAGFYRWVEHYGFSREEADQALNECRYQYELIEPYYLLAKNDPIGRYGAPYVLTPRGRYYLLYLSLQPEYQAKYGVVPGPINAVHTGDRMTEYIVTFLRDIYVLVAFENDFIKLPKQELFRLFVDMNPDVIEERRADMPEVLDLTPSLDVDGFGTLLAGLELFTLDKLKRRSNHYKLYKDRLKKLIQSRYGKLTTMASIVQYRKEYIDFLEEHKVPIRPEAKK